MTCAPCTKLIKSWTLGVSGLLKFFYLYLGMSTKARIFVLIPSYHRIFNPFILKLSGSV